MNQIKVGQLYQHYKGKTYKIIALARYSEEPNSIMVIYQGQYECPTFGANPIWARPIGMFSENIFKDGKEQIRFKKISD
jgi:hypothetical protein